MGRAGDMLRQAHGRYGGHEVLSRPGQTSLGVEIEVTQDQHPGGPQRQVRDRLLSTSRTSSTDNSSKPLDATFEQTAGGQRGPYRAAAFNVPNCASSPRLSDAADTTKASAILSQYLIRVGDNVACLSDPNFLEVCNPPLFKDTAYRYEFLKTPF
ncbi:Uroplakin-3a [Varanus komodoensis]|nr:Uroplakin-3a [Varanus komodoensis]